MVEQLRQLKRAVPFRPFRIVLSNGKAYEIRERYDFMVDPKGTLFVADPEDEFAFYGPSQIESVTLLDPVGAA